MSARISPLGRNTHSPPLAKPAQAPCGSLRSFHTLVHPPCPGVSPRICRTVSTCTCVVRVGVLLDWFHSLFRTQGSLHAVDLLAAICQHISPSQKQQCAAEVRYAVLPTQDACGEAYVPNRLRSTRKDCNIAYLSTRPNCVSDVHWNVCISPKPTRMVYCVWGIASTTSDTCAQNSTGSHRPERNTNSPPQQRYRNSASHRCMPSHASWVNMSLCASKTLSMSSLDVSPCRDGFRLAMVEAYCSGLRDKGVVSRAIPGAGA